MNKIHLLQEGAQLLTELSDLKFKMEGMKGTKAKDWNPVLDRYLFVKERLDTIQELLKKAAPSEE